MWLVESTQTGTIIKPAPISIVVTDGLVGSVLDIDDQSLGRGLCQRRVQTSRIPDDEGPGGSADLIDPQAGQQTVNLCGLQVQ